MGMAVATEKKEIHPRLEGSRDTRKKTVYMRS